MTTTLHDHIRLDASESLSLTELSRACGLTPQEVAELVEYGALTPLLSAPSEIFFSADYLSPLRVASKMRCDYDLDIFTVVLLLDGLQRIEVLERQIRRLEVLLPLSTVSWHHD